MEQYKIIEKIKSKEEKSKRKTVTFRLPIGLINEFQKICNQKDVSYTQVIEQFLEDFIKTYHQP